MQGSTKPQARHIRPTASGDRQVPTGGPAGYGSRPAGNPAVAGVADEVAAHATAAQADTGVGSPNVDAAAEKQWRRHLRTTREGKAFIFVTIGVGVAAFNTGNNLLFLILGFMLSLIILSGVLSEVAIRKLQLSRRLPKTTHVGQPTLIEVVLRNEKRRAPSYSLEVEDLAEGVPTERRCFFLKVAPEAEQIATYRRVPRSRGYVRLIGFRVATRYPFGLFEKWRKIQVPGQLLVFPELLREGPQYGQALAQGDTSSHRARGGGDELADLRGYRDGDEPRHIHWRRTAALGELVVVERHAEAGIDLTIILDNARPSDADSGWDGCFEVAVSRAATWAVRAAQDGQGVAVVVRGGRSPRVQGGESVEPLLRFLALLPALPAEQAPPLAGIGPGQRAVHVPVVVAAGDR